MVLLKVFVVSSGVGRAPASPAAQEDKVYQAAPKTYRILKFVVGIFGLNSILTEGSIYISLL